MSTSSENNLDILQSVVKLRRWECWTLPVVFAAMCFSMYIIFVLAPNEKLMGPIQRILYFHAGSAVACYCSIGLILIFSLAYLATLDKRYDILAQASGEVGFLFCTIVMLTGMIWGHTAWNTWFSWEPRLVSFLMLWLIVLAFNLLRVFGDPAVVPKQSAVLGIVAALTVPVVILSIKYLPQIAQLHPVVVEKKGLKHPYFKYGYFSCMFSLVALQFYLILVRYHVGLLENSAKER